MAINFKRVFGEGKPVIGMVHLGALPGTPLYDADKGLAGLLDSARRDLLALQAAGFDAVMFGNENDRPYEFDVDTASTVRVRSAGNRPEYHTPPGCDRPALQTARPRQPRQPIQNPVGF